MSFYVKYSGRSTQNNEFNILVNLASPLRSLIIAARGELASKKDRNVLISDPSKPFTTIFPVKICLASKYILCEPYEHSNFERFSCVLQKLKLVRFLHTKNETFDFIISK